MLLVFLLLVFAILSHKIGHNNFKYTKKISIFVFSYIFIGLTFNSVNSTNLAFTESKKSCSSVESSILNYSKGCTIILLLTIQERY